MNRETMRVLDFFFMSLAFISFVVSLTGIMVMEGVGQRPFLLICPISAVTFFYLAFRIEIGGR